MCGIAGIFYPGIANTNRRANIEGVRRMMDAQAHRGPDDEGLEVISGDVGSCTLGHRRLAIIDLSDAGKQPMSNAARSIWVSFNGEIYNSRELREELIRRGHHFQSKTDTEILLHGYEEWGIESLLIRLRGMFAFAIFECSQSKGSRLFLVKDRFGIKPLYYYSNAETLLFASEVQALMQSGLIPDEENREAMICFLQSGSIPVPLTTVKGVYALPAAHYLEAGARGVSVKRYWDATGYIHPERERIADFNAITEQTRRLLKEAVRLHLNSDVPLGIFLSGGIDSSALVALASPHGEEALTTLSVIFDETEYSEAKYARLVAERYHTDHREVCVTGKDFYDELPRVFSAMDQPTIDGVNTYFVSKAANQAGLKVVLSGAGSDELFFGYSHHKRAERFDSGLRNFGKLPARLRGVAIKTAIRAGVFVEKNGIEKLSYLQTPSAENFYLAVRGLFTPKQIQELFGLSEKEMAEYASLPSPFNGSRPSSMTESLMLLEFHYYLQSQLLKDTDGMSMAHSIEARVPFLDHKLVEYVFGLPTDVKFDTAMNKPLLVKALSGSLPEAVWNRPKMGFTFPFDGWLKVKSREMKARVLASGLFNSRFVEKVWAGFEAGRIHWSRAWALLAMSGYQRRAANSVVQINFPSRVQEKP